MDQQTEQTIDEGLRRLRQALMSTSNPLISVERRPVDKPTVGPWREFEPGPRITLIFELDAAAWEQARCGSWHDRPPML